jgi:hypothetical protein
LVSVETTRSNGEVIYPFYGKHPEGLLMCDSSGWMSVEIISDPAPTVPTASSREEFLKAPPAEKEKAIDGFYAYYGTWSVDASGTTSPITSSARCIPPNAVKREFADCCLKTTSSS